jgi:hypothetical protein
MTNQETELALRTFLLSRSYELSEAVTINGATGVDIIARSSEGMTYYIEVIGYKKSPSQRSRDFYEAFFRAISRIRLGATRVVLACPWTFQDGLNQRVRYCDKAWLRIGSAFPELELWFVYPTGTQLSYASWNYWGNQILNPPEVIDCTHPFNCRFGVPAETASPEFHAIYNRNQ